jgi:20S proteasome alpha/beta subunit
MELKQAIEVVKQAINIALGAGAFKATQDVAVINTALETITKWESEQHPKEEISPKKVK